MTSKKTDSIYKNIRKNSSKCNKISKHEMFTTELKLQNANLFTNICATSGIEIVASGYQWPSELVRHLCSLSESGQQIHFELGISCMACKKVCFTEGSWFNFATHIDNNSCWPFQ